MHLAILGASGHGKVVADTAVQAGWKEITFFDDAWPELRVNGAWDVKGDTRALLEKLADFDGVLVALGDNHIRALKQKELTTAGANLVTIVHPSAVVSPHALLGAGTVVLANAVVNAFASISDGGIINTGAVIEHDCVIDDFVHVSPNAVLAGEVKIGQQVWVGACASIKQLTTVKSSSVVGMGAVVIRDVPPNVTVIGNPAKIRNF